MLEERRVQPGFFAQFPEYRKLHQQTKTAIESVSLAYHQDLEAVIFLGDLTLSFARKAGEIEPFRSNWQDHVIHSEIIRAQYTNRPAPFKTWEEVVTRYERDWSEWSGLTDSTILPIARQILDHVGLWTDESVRALVLHNLAYRCGVIFAGMEELREYFVAKIPQGIMHSLDEAQDLVVLVADNVSEMVTKRPIGAVQYDMPKTQMSQADWERFLRTEVGNNLGLFSTVAWWTEIDPMVPRSDKMLSYQQIRFAALENFLKDSEYRNFAADPDRIIKDAIKEFKSGTGREK